MAVYQLMGNFLHRLVDGEARRSYCAFVLPSYITQLLYLGDFLFIPFALESTMCLKNI